MGARRHGPGGRGAPGNVVKCFVHQQLQSNAQFFTVFGGILFRTVFQLSRRIDQIVLLPGAGFLRLFSVLVRRNLYECHHNSYVAKN